ncbi:acyl-homoserine-lactone synthase [Vibrio chagasii]|nr:acyl-homoserine-lactone synthase [Vibrio chagasii]
MVKLCPPPPFSNENWQCTTRAATSNSQSYRFLHLQYFQKCCSLPEFDSTFHLQHRILKAIMAKVLRLTVSGNTQQKLYFLYLAQKNSLMYCIK